jgi:hypothetical protein
MYFPYFRGRQYELLALKELARNNLIGRHIVPVLEPIKMSSTLDSCLEAFDGSKLHVAIVYNPEYGDLALDRNATNVLYERFGGLSVVSPSILSNNKTLPAVRLLTTKGVPLNSLVMILNDRDYLSTYNELFQADGPAFTLLPDDRQLRRAVDKNKVLFDDKFQKKARNADYPEDEFFSDDHLYYKEEGYIGFGDYSIIGQDYIENGFAPYAVAIHIVYFDEDRTIRIRHFVSDSNDDTYDVAGKFNEAANKLQEWCAHHEEWQHTMALKTLIKYSTEGYYPGLPTVKKLSIMHHLELMNRFFEK